jgi:hypothetical protein
LAAVFAAGAFFSAAAAADVFLTTGVSFSAVVFGERVLATDLGLVTGVSSLTIFPYKLAIKI